MPSHANTGESPSELARDIGLGQAVALNITDMVGVGPFITLPIIVGAMGGPQAMMGWLLGALLAVCDGLVWAELGAAFPRAGGPYQYLNSLYGDRRLGRLLAFLYVWQLTFSAPLSIASGCVGLAQYTAYLAPSLTHIYFQRSVTFAGFHVGIAFSRSTLVAMAACLAAVMLLYRRIASIGRFSVYLGAGVLATLAWIILSGLTHFHAALAFSFPSSAFHPSPAFFLGLGAAMLTATYDYWGYYNVCFLAGEIRDPARNIPRAILISIAVVGVTYFALNLSVLGVVPWQQFALAPGASGASSAAHSSVIAVMMASIYGPSAGKIAASLVLLTAFASVFSLLLGYSRVPFAAALDGNYFRIFGRVHPRLRIPHVSLFILAGVTCVFCLFQLADLIAALVVIRILLQFLLLHIGLLLLHRRRPAPQLPFRMRLYPLPVGIAIAGFTYILIVRTHSTRELALAAILAAAGLAIYAVRQMAGRFRFHHKQRPPLQ